MNHKIKVYLAGDIPLLIECGGIVGMAAVDFTLYNSHELRCIIIDDANGINEANDGPKDVDAIDMARISNAIAMYANAVRNAHHASQKLGPRFKQTVNALRWFKTSAINKYVAYEPSKDTVSLTSADSKFQWLITAMPGQAVSLSPIMSPVDDNSIEPEEVPTITKTVALNVFGKIVSVIMPTSKAKQGLVIGIGAPTVVDLESGTEPDIIDDDMADLLGAISDENASAENIQHVKMAHEELAVLLAQWVTHKDAALPKDAMRDVIDAIEKKLNKADTTTSPAKDTDNTDSQAKSPKKDSSDQKSKRGGIKALLRKESGQDNPLYDISNFRWASPKNFVKGVFGAAGIDKPSQHVLAVIEAKGGHVLFVSKGSDMYAYPVFVDSKGAVSGATKSQLPTEILDLFRANNNKATDGSGFNKSAISAALGSRIVSDKTKAGNVARAYEEWLDLA